MIYLAKFGHYHIMKMNRFFYSQAIQIQLHLRFGGQVKKGGCRIIILVIVEIWHKVSIKAKAGSNFFNEDSKKSVDG